MADLQSLAEAVRVDLAAASLGVTLTVTRKFDPDADLKDIPTGPGAALVTVIGRSVSTSSSPSSVPTTASAFALTTVLVTLLSSPSGRSVPTRKVLRRAYVQ